MNILIVDDHALFVDGLRFLLEMKYDDVQIFCTEEKAKTLALVESDLIFDLCLLDLTLSDDMTGIEVLRAIRKQDKKLPILVVSASTSPREAARSLCAGAQGFISKSAATDELQIAIQQVIDGREYLPSGWGSMIAQLPVDENTEQCEKNLTMRQKQVLRMVAEGLQNKEIAHHLKISETTIKVHLRDVFKTLKVGNRTACVIKAKEMGIID